MSSTPAENAARPASPPLLRKKRVCFVHLDLGIGGAEQLIVHAARGVKQNGHDVEIYTSFFDPNRCFPGLKLVEEGDSTPLEDGVVPVRLHGAWIPRSIRGRFIIVFSVLRMIWLSLVLAWKVGVTGLFASKHFPNGRPDVIVNDQVSHVNPLLRYLVRPARLVFYCHFPDLLLCTNRGSFLMRTYRALFDWLERVTMSDCDILCVNSEFTKMTFQFTFPGIKEDFIEEACDETADDVLDNPAGAKGDDATTAASESKDSQTTPKQKSSSSSGRGKYASIARLKVLYPPVDLTEVDAYLAREEDPAALASQMDRSVDPDGAVQTDSSETPTDETQARKVGAATGSKSPTSPDDTTSTDKEVYLASQGQLGDKILKEGHRFFLSLNRYEGKKDIPLAIEAYSTLEKENIGSPTSFPLLVIAGGYDKRVEENVSQHRAMVEQAEELGLKEKVLFLRSVPNLLRLHLLRNAVAVIYTPKNEHFGMVPCEAMAMKTLVVASNTGGPRESVGAVGGVLVDKHDSDGFAGGMRTILNLDARNLAQLKDLARRRVEAKFSLKSFVASLEHLINGEGAEEYELV